MEILIYVSFVVLLGLGALFVVPRSNSNGKSKGDAAHLAGSGKTSRSYTMKEVSTHNTRKDCWIIIKDKVYDVTAYAEEHPGGDAILNNAGGDSTEGFFGPQHGTRVFDIIEDFCIGRLKD
ncbi:cytochrome B5-like protein isoform X1 [Panicum virgatum]|uniref:Cytochrome b5 heme-binding domain-containing protein n=1 Tax=Panicum virgatum TaxID=38727 RepID=A0A8T0WBV0_PANVG|nr:cytochrome B5-like protein isoform X1 [Panicum virgatum]XP_039813593.1 cytochrome B5-like protein isoform X1 [Panicum virgatum]KAG2642862.1 hypothetical protein PVAP13_2KG287467 [Panicum virgatum]KAG2642864.1 hypothetical protein PVAP13_2KG287467 [Panicum virgatum]